MLNIGRLSPDAAEYYIGEVATSAEDYYSGRGETEGRWVGSLAAQLGLDGAVDPAHFRAVLDGRHPLTGERLVRSRTGGAKARPGSPNQPTLFDADRLDVARVAARLRITAARVRQLLWAGQRAQATPELAPARYLVGDKVARQGSGGEQWSIARAEVERYEAAHRSGRARPGYDLTLRPPKSVSVLWALGTPEQRRAIRQAHQEATGAAIAYLERHAVFARRGDGDRGKVETDGLVAAAFDHRTSRAGDPLLHTHVVTANLTRTADGHWQAVDGRPLFDQAKPAGFLYQAHLRHLLSVRLGVAFGEVSNGWAEVDGVPEPVIRLFSKRRDEIEEMVAESGYTSARAHQLATLQTRKAKDYGVDADTLQAAWRDEARAAGFDPEELARCFARTAAPRQGDRAALFARLAGPAGLTEQASTFERKDVIEALCERVGPATPAGAIERLADEFLASDAVTALAERPRHVERVHRRGGVRTRRHDLARYTTPEILALEDRLLDRAAGGFGAAVPGGTSASVEAALAARPSLSAEQVAMVRRVCSPQAPALQLVAGRPGSGKTFAMAACVEALAASGVPVAGCALSATAAAELEASTDLRAVTGQPARTVARLRLDLRRDGLAPGTVLVVDEASMVGTRDLAALVEAVAAVGGAVKLVGDPDQHGPVEAGGFFAALCREHEGEVVSLVANNRQLDPTERAAIEDLRQGRVPAALARLEEAGRIVKSPTAAASLAAMVDDWWAAVCAGGADPMIAGPNRTRAQLNTLARHRFRLEGRLGGDALTAGGREFRAGDWVVAKRNDRRLGSATGDFVKNGSTGTVTAVDVHRATVTVAFAKEGVIVLPAAYLEQRFLDYGYARTTYGVQGATLDAALYHASDQSSFEEAYVALTRGRHRARLYIVDGSVEPDEDSVHAGHDDTPTGLDTVTEAMSRRRANRLAHEEDAAAAPMVETFAGWSLPRLATERARLEARLDEAPADVSRALAATSSQLDALLARRRARSASPATGTRTGARAGRDAAALDLAIARTEEGLGGLRERWAKRRQFLRSHQHDVDRLRLVVAAERGCPGFRGTWVTGPVMLIRLLPGRCCCCCSRSV